MISTRFLFVAKLSLRHVWEPVFEPDAATLSGIGDAVGKINAVIPGYFGKENLRDLTGIRTEN